MAFKSARDRHILWESRLRLGETGMARYAGDGAVGARRGQHGAVSTTRRGQHDAARSARRGAVSTTSRHRCQ